MQSIIRTIALALASCLIAPQALAQSADEAKAAFSQFFSAFVARNQAQVAALFAPDAQFYGTTSPELVSSAEGVLQYFTAALDRPEPIQALPIALTASALSDSIVTLAGTWRIERRVDGQVMALGPFRVTAVMQKRDGRWQVVQFHNSPKPAAPAR